MRYSSSFELKNKKKSSFELFHHWSETIRWKVKRLLLCIFFPLMSNDLKKFVVLIIKFQQYYCRLRDVSPKTLSLGETQLSNSNFSVCTLCSSLVPSLHVVFTRLPYFIKINTNCEVTTKWRKLVCPFTKLPSKSSNLKPQVSPPAQISFSMCRC